MRLGSTTSRAWATALGRMSSSFCRTGPSGSARARGSATNCWRSLTADELGEQWSAGVSPVDRVALQGDFGVWLHRAVQTALAPGIDGWTADDVAFHSPWGFDPAAISVPVGVWHGLDDHFVPAGHGRWLADTIPGARAELRDGDGHLRVAAHRIGDVHEWLAQHV
jgi:pimeloyl-ACP methyl ester carboxylesterase